MGVDFGFDLHGLLMMEQFSNFVSQLKSEANEYNESSEAFDQIKIKVENDDCGYIVWINYIPIAFFYGRWKDECGQINKHGLYPIEEIRMIERPIFTNYLYIVFAKYLEIDNLSWVHIFDEATSFINIDLPREKLTRKNAIDFCLDYSWRTKEKAFQRSIERD